MLLEATWTACWITDGRTYIILLFFLIKSLNSVGTNVCIYAAYLLLVGPFVVCFSPLVGSLVASVLIRLVWAGASENVFSMDFATRDYNI